MSETRPSSRPRAGRQQRSQLRFGFFVEGANTTSASGWDALSLLWQELCAHFGVARERVDVHGFSKAQILALSGLPQGVRTTTRIPLDALVRVQHDKKPFEVLVVAFDAHPANQDLLPNSCLRTEVNFLLEAFARSRVLPQRFKAEAAALVTRYRSHRGSARGPGRPPRGPLDAIYMDPMFEALVLADKAAWRDVFGLDRYPKDWPSTRRSDRHLDALMARMIDVGRSAKGATVPRHFHGDAKANKHAFALEAVRKAGPDSPLWQHPIAARLAEVLA